MPVLLAFGVTVCFDITAAISERKPSSSFSTLPCTFRRFGFLSNACNGISFTSNAVSAIIHSLEEEEEGSDESRAIGGGDEKGGGGDHAAIAFFDDEGGGGFLLAILGFFSNSFATSRSNPAISLLRTTVTISK
jgi:hypothetical protein